MTGTCGNCGAETPDDCPFCSQCGQSLEPGRARTADADHARADEHEGANSVSTDGSAMVASAAADGEQEEEETLWEGRYSPKSVIGGWVLAFLLTTITMVTAAFFTHVGTSLFIGFVVAVVLCGGIGLQLVFRRLNAHYRLTNRRFVHQRGLLHLVTNRIEVIDIDDVAYSQRFLERIAGVGTIKIMSSDSSHPELFLYGISNVKDVATQIDEARRAERQKRGLHIELI